MLLNYVINNYLSFEGEQLFSMEADKGPLVVSAVYGANASGKSNFIKSLEDLMDIASGLIKVDSVYYSEHSFANNNNNDHIVFDIEFIVNDLRYRYTLKICNTGIAGEYLAYYSTNRPTRIFEYNNSAVDDGYFSKAITRNEKIVLIAQAKKQKKPILSFLGESGCSKAKNAYSFFGAVSVRRGVIAGNKSEHGKMVTILDAMPEAAELLQKLLPKADFGIYSVELADIDKNYLNDKQLAVLKKAMTDMSEASGRKITKTDQEGIEKIIINTFREIAFRHKIDNDLVTMSEKQESDGTLAVASLLLEIIPVLENGGVLIVDELDRSMHPYMTSEIVRIFKSKTANRKNAQLIFTTHDLSLLDNNINGEPSLDKEEIWFTEKSLRGASGIYPLDSIKNVRSKNYYEKYSLGAFGAVPKVSLVEAIEKVMVDLYDNKK